MTDFADFRTRWDALFTMTPEARKEALEAMSDEELNHFSAINIGDITREEVIEDHLDFIAYEMGEVEDDEEMDF